MWTLLEKQEKDLSLAFVTPRDDTKDFPALPVYKILWNQILMHP